MIGACMLDGFGWFHEADYRRSWLFFDEVSYVLPAKLTTGLLSYPRGLDQRIEFHAEYLSLPSSAADRIAALAIDDAADPEFQTLCRLVPKKDADYAQVIAWSDAEARLRIGERLLTTKDLAVAYLLNKLEHCSRSRGLCPIVGQPYASDMLAWKASRREKVLPWKSPPNRDTYAAFAAGISLDFLDDTDLVDADIDRLAQFKQDNRALLQESQRSLIGTAERFIGLSTAPEFQQELADLRASARENRRILDQQAKDAWHKAGLAILKKTVAAGGTALAGGVLLSSFTTGVVATGIAAAAVVATEILDPLARKKGLPQGMAYLYRLGSLSREAALGL
jgi:hypothetical protein